MNESVYQPVLTMIIRGTCMSVKNDNKNKSTLKVVNPIHFYCYSTLPLVTSFENFRLDPSETCV